MLWGWGVVMSVLKLRSCYSGLRTLVSYRAPMLLGADATLKVHTAAAMIWLLRLGVV